MRIYFYPLRSEWWDPRLIFPFFVLSGIMFGYVSSLVFYHVPDKHGITGLNWRLMLGSAGFPAIFVMAQVYLLPESPRWLLKRGRYVEAFRSLERVRNSPLQAARDLYCACLFFFLLFSVLVGCADRLTD